MIGSCNELGSSCGERRSGSRHSWPPPLRIISAGGLSARVGPAGIFRLGLSGSQAEPLIQILRAIACFAASWRADRRDAPLTAAPPPLSEHPRFSRAKGNARFVDGDRAHRRRRHSIDLSLSLFHSRYDKMWARVLQGSAYINCPFDKAQNDALIAAILEGENNSPSRSGRPRRPISRLSADRRYGEPDPRPCAFDR